MGETALLRAVRYEHTEMVQCLVEHKANVNADDDVSIALVTCLLINFHGSCGHVSVQRSPMVVNALSVEWVYCTDGGLTARSL